MGRFKNGPFFVWSALISNSRMVKSFIQKTYQHNFKWATMLIETVLLYTCVAFSSAVFQSLQGYGQSAQNQDESPEPF
jgi:cobalamin biosynthesis protein CobD/CbiB